MENGKTCYLTTIDNPFDKMDDYDSWLDFDSDHGYYTDAYLDRIARISPSMSEIEIENEYERAIDEIIKYDFRGIYIKKYADTPIDDSNAETEEEKNETLEDILFKYTWGGVR